MWTQRGALLKVWCGLGTMGAPRTFSRYLWWVIFIVNSTRLWIFLETLLCLSVRIFLPLILVASSHGLKSGLNKGGNKRKLSKQQTPSLCYLTEDVPGQITSHICCLVPWWTGFFKLWVKISLSTLHCFHQATAMKTASWIRMAVRTTLRTYFFFQSQWSFSHTLW